MWVYSQSTGSLRHDDALTAVTCYSGAGDCKNQPDAQDQHGKGPIPRGRYQMCQPVNSEHGPYSIPLAPDFDNQMFGRSGFLIHGDSITHPGRASKGCIVAPRSVREEMWVSGDRILEVVE